MNIILYDGQERNSLLPFTYIRAIADLRIGIFTIKEKWEKRLKKKVGVITYPYIQPKYDYEILEDTCFVNASFLPDIELLDSIAHIKVNEALWQDNTVIAFKTNTAISTLNHLYLVSKTLQKVGYTHSPIHIRFPWDLFTYNGNQIKADIDLLSLKQNGASINTSNTIINPNNIFVEEGARVSCSIINATEGPVYIGKDAEIMEGSIIKGPFALCDHATVKMGAKIYGDTTIGPHCKVGGEVSNSIFIGYSNKGHDGFLGNAVIGEWCNIGADTNSSNLKNNYGNVKVWNYAEGKQIDTGLQFCGLLMGDHSKCGINTMFNTGTVIGISSNIYGAEFPPKFIPSFSWGGVHDGWQEHDFHKAEIASNKMMNRRNLTLSEIDKQILWQVFEDSAVFRSQFIQGRLNEK